MKNKYVVKWNDKHWKHIIYNTKNNIIHSTYSYYERSESNEYDEWLKERCIEINRFDTFIDDQLYLKEIYRRCLPIHKQILRWFKRL